MPAYWGAIIITTEYAEMTTVFDFTVNDIHGQPKSLAEYRGKVLLVVNVASQCGFTPQYRGLQELYQAYQARGLMVLGFPCNQFGRQEPGDNAQIEQFCDTRFRVTFPLFDKIEVNGPGTAPLYQYLKHGAPGLLGSERIKWNFTKFLVGKDGTPVHRYAPLRKPEQLVGAIEALLSS
jgi:glutathione peroxidase